MNNILYSAIIKEKNVILCEYTEYTGNFNQILQKFIKILQNSQNKTFKSKIIIGNYQIFCIKENIIYYVLFTQISEKNEDNIFFSFLLNIKNALLNKFPLNELENKKSFSLKIFLPILKENISTFNKNNQKFVNKSNTEIISNLIDYYPKNNDENNYIFPILSMEKVHDESNNVDNNSKLLYNNKSNLDELLLVETSTSKTKSSLFSFHPQNNKCCKITTIIILIVIIIFLVLFVLYKLNIIKLKKK